MFKLTFSLHSLMYLKRSAFLFLILLIAMSFVDFSVAQSSSFSVNLPIDNTPFSFARTGPVRVSFPLEEGKLFNLANSLQLRNDAGVPIPFSATVGATWYGDSKSIRLVDLTFPVNVPASTSVNYVVTVDPSASLPSPPVSSPITLTQGTNTYTINTGVAQFVLPTNKFNFFDSVTVAGNQLVSVADSQDGGLHVFVNQASEITRDYNSGATQIEVARSEVFNVGDVVSFGHTSFTSLEYCSQYNNNQASCAAQLGCSFSVPFCTGNWVVPAGSLDIEVQNPSAFEPGMVISLDAGSNSETLTISSIVGSKLFFTTPTQFNHNVKEPLKILSYQQRTITAINGRMITLSSGANHKIVRGNSITKVNGVTQEFISTRAGSASVQIEEQTPYYLRLKIIGTLTNSITSTTLGEVEYDVRLEFFSGSDLVNAQYSLINRGTRDIDDETSGQSNFPANRRPLHIEKAYAKIPYSSFSGKSVSLSSVTEQFSSGATYRILQDIYPAGSLGRYLEDYNRDANTIEDITPARSLDNFHGKITRTVSGISTTLFSDLGMGAPNYLSQFSNSQYNIPVDNQPGFRDEGLGVVSSLQRSIGVSADRYFWQNAPNALSVDEGAFYVEMYPSDVYPYGIKKQGIYGGRTANLDYQDFRLWGGERYTVETGIAYSTDTSSNVRSKLLSLKYPIWPINTQYTQQTKAYFDYHPYFTLSQLTQIRDASTNQVERTVYTEGIQHIESIYDRNKADLTNNQRVSFFDDNNLVGGNAGTLTYGKHHFGSLHRGDSGDKLSHTNLYDWLGVLMMCYLQSGDYLCIEWADRMGNALMNNIGLYQPNPGLDHIKYMYRHLNERDFESNVPGQGTASHLHRAGNVLYAYFTSDPLSKELVKDTIYKSMIPPGTTPTQTTISGTPLICSSESGIERARGWTSTFVSLMNAFDYDPVAMDFVKYNLDLVRQCVINTGDRVLIFMGGDDYHTDQTWMNLIYQRAVAKYLLTKYNSGAIFDSVDLSYLSHLKEAADFYTGQDSALGTHSQRYVHGPPYVYGELGFSILNPNNWKKFGTFKGYSSGLQYPVAGGTYTPSEQVFCTQTTQVPGTLDLTNRWPILRRVAPPGVTCTYPDGVVWDYGPTVSHTAEYFQPGLAWILYGLAELGEPLRPEYFDVLESSLIIVNVFNNQGLFDDIPGCQSSFLAPGNGNILDSTCHGKKTGAEPFYFGSAYKSNPAYKDTVGLYVRNLRNGVNQCAPIGTQSCTVVGTNGCQGTQTCSAGPSGNVLGICVAPPSGCPPNAPGGLSAVYT